jgi:ATP adenylyltransferase
MEYIQSEKNNEMCIFCDEMSRPDGPENLIIYRGRRAFIILNRYPYTSGHLMVVRTITWLLSNNWTPSTL